MRRAARLADAAAILLLSVGAAGVAPAGITLNGKGLAARGTVLTFARTPTAAAVAAVSAVLGKPTTTGSHGDCGQGDVIRFARFRGDFELSFVKGRLSGWTEDGNALATDRGVRVGVTVAALRKAYPDVSIDPGNEAEGGIGPSFQREDGPNGWVDGIKPSSHVAGMFAGATCLAGI